MTSNGIGLGHLTRLMAIARRLRSPFRPVFVTLSQAMPVVEEEAGFLAEFLPFHSYLEVPSDEWNKQLRADLLEILAFHSPSVLVFDGNMPYQGLIDALNLTPDVLPVWVRRGFWRHGSNDAALKRQGQFHMILEPADIAGAIDDGPTRSNRERTRDVPPIRYLDNEEFLPKSEAIAALDLDNGKMRVVIQLGSGNNFDISAAIAILGEEAERNHATEFVLIESPIQDEPIVKPKSFVTRTVYPLTRYLLAFDAAISAVGYNSFHELLLGGCPTLFLPNEHPSMDDQLRRAQYAQSAGLALVARHSDPYDIKRKLRQLLEPSFQSMTRDRLKRLDRTNGAFEAAQTIGELALMVRADTPT